MSTSDRVVWAEAGAAAIVLVGVITLLAPEDVWLVDRSVHPMWFPIIVLSACYAARGLFAALGFTIAGLLAVSLATEGTIAGFVARTRSVTDLFALVTAVLVAWMAMAHERRLRRGAERLTEATERRRQAEDYARSLQASLVYLRSRHDRLDMSLSLWRNLASRLERGDAHTAARAVLELCEIRGGARAGIVQLRDVDRLITLACRGEWPTRPPGHDYDETIRAAFWSKHVTPAGPGTSEDDSDVAVPVLDEDNGSVIGVIALRGLSPGHMRAADLRDLGVLAQWLAPTLSRQLRRQLGKTLGELPPPVSKDEVSL